MHWSEVYARKVLEKVFPKKDVVIGSGISLSASVHVGHSREFLTAALIAHAVKNLGGNVRFLAFADDMDPLKKVYSFLPKEYSRWIGCPLYRIPDPFGRHKSYSEHFLAEFIEGLNSIGLNPEIIRVSELYKNGSFLNHVARTLSKSFEINSIIDQVTGRHGLPKQLFSPECPECFSVRSTSITGIEGQSLFIHCNACLDTYEINIEQGGGKLSWRCDWPARWAQMEIDLEPVAQDHYSAGGSYQSALLLVEKIYGSVAPVPVPYAWVRSASSGAMHSSSGNTVSMLELSRMYPLEIIWWMFARRDPKSIVTFDPALSLINESRLLRDNLNEQGQYLESVQVINQMFKTRTWLSAYPFNHVVLASQLADFDSDRTLEILQRPIEYKGVNIKVPVDDLKMIKYWLEHHGKIYQVLIRKKGEHSPILKPRIRLVMFLLSDTLKSVVWEANAIHDTIYNVARSEGLDVKELFCDLYKITIGQKEGPRLGWLFETLGREKVLELLS